MLTRQSLMSMTLCNIGLLPDPDDVLNNWFRLMEAGWVHDGDPTKPHAKLHSGLCSTAFFLCKRILDYGNLREILAKCIIRSLHEAGLERVDGVFGSPYSSILLAGDIGRMLSVPTYVVEKDPEDPAGKRMRFKADHVIPEGANLLQVEELVTKFDSGEASKQAIIAGNPYSVRFAKQVGVLVHRPPVINRDLADGRVIVPFIEREVFACPPEQCELCKQGSVPLPPKGDNWKLLTAV